MNTLRRSVTLCAGVSGSGKTSFALRYLLNVAASCRFVFDPDGEVASRLQLSPAETVAELEDALPDGWVVYDPAAMFPGRVADAFLFFCAWVYSVSNRGPGRKILLVDEVWKFCHPTHIPDELALCLQTGRKRGLELVFATQRPNRLNGAVLNEVSEAVIFKLQDRNAVEKVTPWGLTEDEIFALPMLQFIAVNCDSGCVLRGRLN